MKCNEHDRYAGLASQECMLMEDLGLVTVAAAYFRVMRRRPRSERAMLRRIRWESRRWVHEGESGRAWRGYFWSGKLEASTYLDIL